MTRQWLAVALSLACAACAHESQQQAAHDPLRNTKEAAAEGHATQDPLHNTKKLVTEGHATLYRNGAFEVPMTTIHLIPAGPDAIDLAAELAGMRAGQSFEESVKHARESVDFAKAGVQHSVSAAGAIDRGARVVAHETRTITRFGGQIVEAAPAVGSAIIGASVSYAKPAYEATREAGEAIASGAIVAGSALSRQTDRAVPAMAGAMSEQTGRAASTILSGSVSAAKDVSRGTLALSRRHALFAAEKFVKGYAAAPAKLGQRASAVGEAASLDKFVAAYQRSNEWRASASGKFTDVFVDTAGHYGSDVGHAFSAAAEEIDKGAKDSGYTLAMLKSLRWVLQGVLWDATIKPVGKMTVATLGYVTVNAVAFPALITVHEGAVVANLAVEVTWNSAGAVYDVTAPTATAAVAGLFSAVELVGGETAAGGGIVAGTAASGGTYVAGKAAAGAAAVGGYAVGKAAAGATAGGGYVAGKTIQYVAAPLSAAGIAVGGTAVGVVAGTATAVTGAGVAATGVAGEATARVAGTAAAGAVGAGGSVVSVAAGTALGAYEISKAVVVPAGYNLGAGIVLSYGTMTQLGAQSVLAVSDASYMVLSLEGPRWVLYAVKGNVDKGENIPVGAVLDLKAMQKSGETFYAVPASEEEIKRVVGSVYDELPVLNVPAANTGTEKGAASKR